MADWRDGRCPVRHWLSSLCIAHTSTRLSDSWRSITWRPKWRMYRQVPQSDRYDGQILPRSARGTLHISVYYAI